MIYPILALAGLAVAQAPSGGVPTGLQTPSTSGFRNAAIHPSKGGRSICVTGDVSVSASTSKNLKLNYQLPANQSQVTDTFLQYVTPGNPFPMAIMGGTQNVSGVYNISATLCIPGSGLNSSVVQIATHGIGFDKSYWDLAPGYSYADIAADSGYPTFFYDRLGVGKSSRPDAINVVQAPLEVEIKHSLIQMLRNGTFGGRSFDRVVATGHSFGSIITNAITAQYPQDVDAAVLTGFTTNSSALNTFITGLNLELAYNNQPYRFAGLGNGYLVSSTAVSTQIGFFRSPGFDPMILSMAEATKQTVTFGELFSLSSVIAPATQFTGAIAVVNGHEDFPFCFGNCTYPTDLAAAVKPALYPMASNLSTQYVAADTGHGVNLHYSAGAANEFIQNFIDGLDL